jgi:hypothetical protein
MAGMTSPKQKVERTLSEKILKPKEWVVDVTKDIKDEDRNGPGKTRSTRAVYDFTTIKRRMEELRSEALSGDDD